MNDRNLSKFLSLLLRHKPETIDLNLDKNGWADLDELLSKLAAKGKKVSLKKASKKIKNAAQQSNKRFFGKAL